MDRLKNSLSKKRYIHSLGVCDTAVELAVCFGADADKAYIAGLYHDCAKGMSIDEQLEKCREYNIELTKHDIMCPPVIHAPLGAEIARLEYDITDNDILNAIRHHTVGGLNMTILDKIIYTADMIEPNRNFKGVEELRLLAKNDINKAYFECVKHSLLFNINNNKAIHPDTLISYNECIVNVKEQHYNE